MERWRGGEAERWRGGEAERWRGGEVERRRGGEAERWRARRTKGKSRYVSGAVYVAHQPVYIICC